MHCMSPHPFGMWAHERASFSGKMQSFLRMKINQSASECVNLSTWLWCFCTELCRLICCIETAVIIFTGRMCIYLHVCSKKKKIDGEKVNCTNMSGEKLLARLTLVLSLHKHAHPWHQSLLIVGFFSNTYKIFYLQKQKKKSSNKVFTSTLILCYVITVFASIQYLHTTAVGARGAAVALWCLWLFYRCSSFLPQF